ncbi:MAG TPA: DUF3108 domain-containing protein [Xanthomonadales bacterium]|nr:DUF3108 domain-containing protein [Xanthomonadales bacterium]
MMTRSKLTAILLAFLLPLPCLADQPADFEARLELYRNGKLSGETLFRLETVDGRWTMHSSTEGTKGMASWIGLKENSTGEGDWHAGKARPLRYERNVKAIVTREWSAEFDWDNEVVHTVYPDGASTLELEPGVVDESSLGLAIRMGLRRGESEWRLRQLDEDEIEDAHFRVSEVKAVDTPLGCMQTHVVEKVRAASSTRYTRTYYASDHDFAPVLIEHGKKGGDQVEGRVISLKVNGAAVAAGPACPQ